MHTDACTLPTVERPLRLDELDTLFRTSVTGVESDGTSTRMELAGTPGLRERVLDLTARESDCCSFFTFRVSGDDATGLVLDVEVPPARSDILHALTARAAELSA